MNKQKAIKKKATFSLTLQALDTLQTMAARRGLAQSTIIELWLEEQAMVLKKTRPS